MLARIYQFLFVPLHLRPQAIHTILIFVLSMIEQLLAETPTGTEFMATLSEVILSQNGTKATTMSVAICTMPATHPAQTTQVFAIFTLAMFRVPPKH
jgi:hypothetical protein